MRRIEKENVIEWIDVLGKVSGRNAALSKRLLKLASKPSRQRAEVNLRKLEKFTKSGDNVAVPGKVLAAGDISKAFSIAAIEYSQDAIEKLKKAGCEMIDVKKMLEKDNVRIII